MFLIKFIASQRSKGLLRDTIAFRGKSTPYSPATRSIRLAPMDMPTPTKEADGNFFFVWLMAYRISCELAMSGRTLDVNS